MEQAMAIGSQESSLFIVGYSTVPKILFSINLAHIASNAIISASSSSSIS